MVGPFLPGTETGTISSLNVPAAMAWPAFPWDLAANSSCSALNSQHMTYSINKSFRDFLLATYNAQDALTKSEKIYGLTALW